jgi:hypothetical protein
MPTQPVSPRIATTHQIDGGKVAATTSSRKNVGIACINSMIRESARSTSPP